MKSSPLITLLALVLLVACSDSDNNAGLEAPALTPPPAIVPPDAVGFSATLHRTEGGIPHIIAEDFASLGFGTGYAVAEDHFCEQAKNILKFRAQLAEHFGPDNDNLQSDFLFKYLADTGTYEAEIRPEHDALFAGYAAGFNRYIRDIGINNISDPACAGADWIPTLTGEDMKTIHLTPVFLPNLASLIVPAAPPMVVAKVDKAEAKAIAKSQALSPGKKLELAALAQHMLNPSDLGSNGVAIGSDHTAHGGGLLYTNPHLSLSSFDFRMHGRHHIIPGVTNVLGANQAQRADIGFGTNGDIAWTNTVSVATQLMFYKLDLVPGNPLAYTYDGEERIIEPFEVTVKVLNDSGTVTEASHNFYLTHNGIMVGGQFPWLTSLAFSVRIVDEGARALQGAALDMSRATTVRELYDVISVSQHLPAINTIAVDSTGETLMGVLGPYVNFTDQQLVDCLFSGPVFLGNSAACEWNTDEDSAAPGLLGASKLVHIFRKDYVTNSNNSAWLSNPEAPLTGWPTVLGDVETERSPRTRSGLDMVQRRIDGTDGLPGNTFDLANLEQLMLSNQSGVGMLLRDDLVTLCSNTPSVDVDGTTVDLGEACVVLANWDLASNVESRGAHLFREFMRATLNGENGRTLPSGLNYVVAFNAADAVNTPRGLDTTDNPLALEALGRAVVLLQEAGIALDAELGSIQGITRNGDYIAMPGGEEFEGVFNKMDFAFAGSEGYPELTGSSASWVMVAQPDGDNTLARGLTAYSQSSDSTSEHYSDLTKVFASGQLVDLPFTQEAVEAAALSTLDLSEGTDDCADEGWMNFTHLDVSDENSCRQYFNDVADAQIKDFVDG